MSISLWFKFWRLCIMFHSLETNPTWRHLPTTGRVTSFIFYRTDSPTTLLLCEFLKQERRKFVSLQLRMWNNFQVEKKMLRSWCPSAMYTIFLSLANDINFKWNRSIRFLLSHRNLPPSNGTESWWFCCDDFSSSLCTFQMPIDTVAELDSDKYFLTHENFTGEGNWIFGFFLFILHPPPRCKQARISSKTLIRSSDAGKAVGAEKANNYDW